MKLRKAILSDLDTIMRILSEAREAQRAQGFVQWQDGYPASSTIVSDIERGDAYMLIDDGNAAGYVAIAEGDSEYDRLRHIWQMKGNRYCVAHRLGLADSHRGRKISGRFFSLIEAKIVRRGTRLIRIDTGLPNKAMQHILEKRGYTRLGTHEFVWGERLAYEKLLESV